MSNVLARAIVCRQCGHQLEDHGKLGCDRFIVKHKQGKPKNVVSVDFCQCNLNVKDLLKLEPEHEIGHG